MTQKRAVKLAILAILLVIFLAANDSIADLIRIGRFAPDFLLLFPVFAGLLRGRFAGCGVGALVGLCHDLLIGRYIGAGVLAMGLVGLFSGWIGNKFFRENYLLPMVAAAVGKLTADLSYWVLISIFGAKISLKGTLLFYTLPSMLYTAILAPFLYVLVYKLADSRWFREEDRF